jgi:chromosome segregation ATPase
MRNFLFLFIAGLFGVSTMAQTASIGSFNKTVFDETFSFNSGQFQLSTDAEKYIILDDGDLFISRNASNDYSFFAQSRLDLSSYRIKTALKLGPSNNKSPYVGLLVNTQLDGSGTVAIEINAKQQYRVRQIQNGKPKYISGTRENGGWKNAESLNGAEEYNYLDIVVHQGSFDVYINYIYVDSYTVPDYQNGGFGFLVSGNTKARVDFAFVYKQGEAVSFEEYTTANQQLLVLEEQLSTLKEEHQLLEETHIETLENLAASKNNLSEANGVQTALTLQLKSVENQLNELNAKMAAKNQQIVETENQNTELKIQITAQNNALNDREESISVLEKNNATLKKKLESAKAGLASTNINLQTANQQNNTLNAQNNQQKQSINSLHKSNAEKESQISSLKKQIVESSNLVKTKEALLLKAQNEYRVLEGQHDDKEEMIATLDSELAQLKKEMGTKHKIISSLSTKNKAYADSVSRLKNTDESLIQTQNELELLKSTVSNTKNQLMALLSDKEILETQLEEQKQIAGQFAESYRLEVQKNSLLQKEINFNQSEFEVSNQNKSNTIYRIQIGIFEEEIELDNVKGVTIVPTQDGKYIYLSETFENYNQAKVGLMQIAELGYKEAFIVKF